MQHLTTASHELFKRTPDETFPSVAALSDHCQSQREDSAVLWHSPGRFSAKSLDTRTLVLAEGEDLSFPMNDWSFGQLCRLAGVEKRTINRLTANTASQVFQETLPGGNKPLQVFTIDEQVRSIHGSSYTRLHNAEVLDTVLDAADGFDAPPKGFNGATGLYAGEQDMFCFLIDPTDKAILRSVSSYGHRLCCDWKTRRSADVASFNWGNAGFYRKYSADYQAFLQRPKDVIAREFHQLAPGWELGVVSLDLSGFYDRIDRTRLLAKLRSVCQQKSEPSDDLFWKCAETAFSWSWERSDLEDGECRTLFKNRKLPETGLPQGLVASGFFSNICMIEFDAAMRALVVKHAQLAADSREPLILDYCRYVDDMRIVVKWKSRDEDKQKPTCPQDKLCHSITRIVNLQLEKHCKGQECNRKKTKYASYWELAAENSPAAVMNWIQDRHSGPSSLEELRETTLALEGLLQMDHRQPKTSNALALGSVLRSGREVRDDTIIRFASYRQLVALRQQREMSPFEADDAGRSKVDAEIDKASRRLIYLWSLDPSLTIVLRHAFNLKPSPELLSPVLEAIDQWLRLENDRNCEGDGDSKEKNIVARRVCYYVLADLLKAALIETGQNCGDDRLPEDADLEGYLEKFSPLLDAARYKHLRRNHLASMLGLALKQLNARKTYDEPTQADLVILPEYAVHKDDIDLIERFSDKTRAIVFCGLALHDHPRKEALVNSGLWLIPDYDAAGRRSFLTIPQGKKHPTESEKRLGVEGWRPCQHVIELHCDQCDKPFRISAAMCYDATDIALANDLRNISDMLIVSANNKDVETFDRMASAWSYHMYQYVLVVNSGQFGGTFATAPHKERFERVLVHNHGGKHASVSILELDLASTRIRRLESPLGS